jgi:2-polyprenyl-6-hydroxyphenyl methylase/3-demethylubiquinone-9 3-methyltransferase
MLIWTPEQLGIEVYNDTYVNYDPDYKEVRPSNWAHTFYSSIDYRYLKNIRHLDYGGGSGIMSKILKNRNWESTSYDPYYENNVRPQGKYNLITAIEVVEHALDIRKTLDDIISFLDKTGVLVFSTLLANKKTDIDWWYIGARNGHISILSVDSLKLLAKERNMYFQSINEGLHILQPTRNTVTEQIGRAHV